MTAIILNKKYAWHGMCVAPGMTAIILNKKWLVPARATWLCRRANFNSDGFQVGLPVFTIHGNHDDPSGADNLSAVDVLSTCKLVNYFGKTVCLWAESCQLPSVALAINIRAPTPLYYVSQQKLLRLLVKPNI